MLFLFSAFLTVMYPMIVQNMLFLADGTKTRTSRFRSDIGAKEHSAREASRHDRARLFPQSFLQHPPNFLQH